MRNELYLYATYYQSMGMNISPIEKTNYKKPVIENWKRYISIKQDEIHNFNWEDSVGIGLISGFNEYRALDIDELYYSYYDRRGRYDTHTSPIFVAAYSATHAFRHGSYILLLHSKSFFLPPKSSHIYK